jgi:hypothetical protein
MAAGIGGMVAAIGAAAGGAMEAAGWRGRRSAGTGRGRGGAGGGGSGIEVRWPVPNSLAQKPLRRRERGDALDWSMAAICAESAAIFAALALRRRRRSR